MKILKPLRYFLLAAAVVALIYGVVQTNKLNRERRHDPENIQITVTDKSREFHRDEKAYYILFDFEIENGTEASIDYLTVLTHITDQDGNELGTIRSEFGSIRAFANQSGCLELAAGDSVVKQTCLKERNPEGNEFFVLTYNADYEELSFACEPESVYFSDNYHIEP